MIRYDPVQSCHYSLGHLRTCESDMGTNSVVLSFCIAPYRSVRAVQYQFAPKIYFVRPKTLNLLVLRPVTGLFGRVGKKKSKIVLIKKIKWWGRFLIWVGSILLLSSRRAYQMINCLWPYSDYCVHKGLICACFEI